MIIAFTGYKGSGKDTAAKALPDHLNFKFADGLKAMLASYLVLYGHTTDEVHSMLEGEFKEVPAEAFMGQNPRWAMQSLGTEWGRTMIHSDLWHNLMRKRLQAAIANEENVVITDLRFLNEAMLVYSLGGKIIRVRKPGTQAGFHPSEKEMDLIIPSYTIMNNGSVEDLLNKVLTVIRG